MYQSELTASIASMKTFPLTLTLVLLALKGMEAKVSSCLICETIDSNSACAKGTVSGGCFTTVYW